MKPSQFFGKVGIVLKYVLCILVLPLAIGIFIYRVIEFRKYTKIIRRAVNTNDDFFNYLEKHDFVPDWIGRLYSIQPIPKEFRDFSDDELYDMTMRSMFPMLKLMEKSVLIDVAAVIVSRISDELYSVTLTPFCFPKLRNSIITLSVSLIVNITWAIIFWCII